MRTKHVWYLCILALLCWNEGKGQVLGPEVRTGSLGIGYFRKWVHRRLEPHFLSGADWKSALLFMKYGPHQRLTLSVEGYVADNQKYERYPNSVYCFYTIGAGISVCVLQTKGLRTTFGLYYNEMLFFDKSVLAHHHNIREILGAIQIEKVFSLSGQNLALWLGPVYVKDEVMQYRHRHQTVRKNTSFDNFGFALGANLLMLDHLEPFFHFVYVDFFQPRLGIAYRL